MRIRAWFVGLTAVSLVGAAVVASPAAAETGPATRPSTNPGPALVSDPVNPALSPALRDLPVSSQPRTGGEVPEGLVDPDSLPTLEAPRGENESGPVQRSIPGEAAADLVPVNSFAGGTTDSYAGQSSPFSPPDTVGDVGPNHYVQMVNVTYQIWDKQGTSLAGPTNINLLWSNLPDGTPCKVTNDGDPIVLYDQAADRWMLSQFSVRGTGYQMCIAYSTTPDPTGTYNTYAFDMPEFPDYEKFGIWPDGLYMSTYEGDTLGAFVFDRAAMLAGSPATFQRFAISSGGGPRQQRILPADWDGVTAPPADAPNPFLMSVDAQVQGGAVDRLELYNFHVDWTTPANSTFTLDQTLPTDPFNIDIGSNCMDPSFPNPFRECVPQPGTSNKVDDLSNRLMWRLQYRNFGDHQALVTNQTVNSGNDTAALRWYELRNAGSSWSIHQQNTFAPADAAYRWMGSAALDGAGNMALGYSISDATSIYPSINYTGQRVGAPLNQLSEPETRMFTGVGSQTVTNRWGDYSAMSVDPVDECTFWYTQMHIGTGGTRETRIGTARYTSCAQPTAELELVKTVDPAGSTDKTQWKLSAVADAPLEGKNIVDAPGGTAGYQSVYAETTYVLSESGTVADYTNGDTWKCTDSNGPYAGQNGNAVTIKADDKVSCEVTNTHETGELKLVKATDPSSVDVDLWTLSADAVTPFEGKNFSNLGGQGTFESVYSKVEYTLGETGPGGYTPTDWVCKDEQDNPVSSTGGKVIVAKNTKVTCELTNTRDTAQLKLVKKVTGDNNAQSPGDWDLSADAAVPLDGKNFTVKGDADAFQSVYSGITYDLSETGPGNYTASDWVCEDADGPIDVTEGSKVTVETGATVTCEITNDRDLAQLKLVKQVEGKSAPNDWTLTAKASAPLDDKDISTPGGSGTLDTVYAGTEYTLSETGPGGYSPGEWVCLSDDDTNATADQVDGQLNTGDKITLKKGEKVTCTIVNTRDLGSLTITKEFNPQNSGYSGTFDITYTCLEGANPVKNGTVQLGAGQSTTITGLPTGAVCSVDEPALPANPTGWTFNQPTYSPASGQATVTAKDQTVSVTVVNSVSQANPTVVKRMCPIKVTLVKPKPKKVGNRVLVKKIKTKKSSCKILKPVVLCRSLGSRAAGEKAFCVTKVTKKGKIRVKTRGYDKVRVTVIVRAKPKKGSEDAFKPNSWRKSWRLR